ncbi:MAG: aminodeoxychorismate synthase component I [Gammaproteobacteria bacterium]|nr:aminodeoxychorismate synthase component I [Gammaproteobacteria bacterium]
MHLPKLQAIPYNRDSARLFSAVAEWPWSVFLDSGKPGSDQGRYDIIAAEPVITVVTRNGETRIVGPDSDTTSRANPFVLLRETLGKIQRTESLPFIGGAIGYAGYGLANCLTALPTVSTDPSGMPDMCFGIYEWALVVDHQKRQSWLVGQSEDGTSEQQWNNLIALFSFYQTVPEGESFGVAGDIQSNLSLQQYSTAFDEIQRYIQDGDCYQVNYAQEFSANCHGSPWNAYSKLRELNPSPYGAYLNTPYGQILSSSPERFLRLSGKLVETKPIKGTKPRSSNPQVDAGLLRDLENSEKERAENLMIVDLLRNDLGKCCEPGTIQVPKLFKVESFATVHHLVSKITGTLAAGKDALDLLSDCFPGGSITGAPKYRAMEIIEELEPDPRGIYCGTVGYIGFDGEMDTNIAIRTMVHRDGKIHFSAGGGIVADSNMESEYQETFDKAGAILEMLAGNY